MTALRPSPWPVCPARAGMIRRVPILLDDRQSLPRTRGDDPQVRTVVYVLGLFAPHARG